MAGIKEKLVLWLSCVQCLAFLLPNHYSPWYSAHQEMGAAFAFVPLCIWAAFQSVRLPFLALVAASLAVVPIVQLGFELVHFASDAWMATLYLFGFAFAVLAGSVCVRDDKTMVPELNFSTITRPWVGIVLAAILSVGIQLYQWLLLGDRGIYVAELPPNYRPFGNLAQPNQLATMLLFALAGIIFLFEGRRISARIALASAGLLAVGLVMTGSRSALLTLVWLLLAFLVFRRRCHLQTSVAAVVSITVFYTVASLSWSAIDQWLMIGNDTGTALVRAGDAGVRQVIWRSMADAIMRSPWAGYGWGQIGSAQTAVTLDYPPTFAFFDSSHNLALDLALWNGLPIAFVVLVCLGSWFAWQIYCCRDGYSWSVLMAVGAVFTHAMVEFPLNYSYFLLPTGLLMGALSAKNPLPLHPLLKLGKSHFPIIRAACVASGMFALGVLLIVATEYWAFEDDWQLMRFQEQRIGSFEKTPPPPAIVLTGLREFMRFSRTEPLPGMSKQDIDWMRRVSERYAYASPMFRYALAQALNANSQGAQLTLRRLCHMQTPGACTSAKQQWTELKQVRWPQLASTPFPVTDANKDEINLRQ